MSEITVGSEITIRYPSDELISVVTKELTVRNPLYATLESMGRNTWGTPRTYQLFKCVAGDLVIPFGAVSNEHIQPLLRGCTYKTTFTEPKRINLEINIPPLDYQQKALDYILGKHLHRGIIVGGTGSGKTNIGLYLIKELGLRALWVTHTKDLLKQSKDRALSIFKSVDLGLITNGKIEVGKDITFATVQTLSKVANEVKDDFDIIIVDEAHHCVGSPTLRTMFYKTLNTLRAPYKFGLTATPSRSDGLQKMVFAILGNIAYTIPKSEVSARILPIEYHTIDNNNVYDIFDYTDSAGMVNPSALTRMLSFDSTRNELIVDTICNIVPNSGGILVLAKLVAHCELLVDMLSAHGLNTALLVGKTKNRKEILNSDKIQVIVATNSLAKEGLDLVRYSDLVIAYNLKQKNEFTQAAGRVRRVDGIKTCGSVYEVNDKGINFLTKRIKTHKHWANML